MNTNDDEGRPAIGGRVADLEREVAALKARVAALEAATGSESVSVTALDASKGAEPVLAAATDATPEAEKVAASVAPPPLPQWFTAAVEAAAVPPAAPPEVPRTSTPPATAERVVPPRPPVSEPVAATGWSVIEPAQADGPSPFTEFLRAVHLLPPSGPDSGEVQLGAWWATRIGALLVVLAVVFLGVYVSIGTPPWVKLAELAAIAVGMSLGGVWLEKKTGRFGSVILGGGLALTYFTAFAAYAVPAVKVTDDPWLAAGLQAAVVALVFGVSVRRNSKTTATMATLLGFVSAFFSMAEGFDDFAVFGALTLAAVSVAMRRAKGWAAPVLLAVWATHLVVASAAMSVWDSEAGARGPWFVFAVVAAAWAVFFLSIVLEGPGEDGRFSRVQRWLQSFNGALGAVAGAIAANTVLGHGDLSWYFFAAAGVLAGAGVWAWRVAPTDGMMAAWGVKASALAATGVMIEWEASTRWMALAIEACVLTAAARRTRRGILALIGGAVWVLSLLFFLNDGLPEAEAVVGAAGLMVGLYALLAPVLLAWILREVSGEKENRGSEIFMGLIAAVPVWRACTMVHGEAWGPLAFVAGAAVLAASAWLMRSTAPYVGGGLAAAWAHVALHTYPAWTHGAGWLWACVAVVGGATAAGAWWLTTRGAVDADEGATAEGLGDAAWLRVGGIAATVCAVAALTHGVALQWSGMVALAVATWIAVALAGAGRKRGSRDLQIAGVTTAVTIAAWLTWRGVFGLSWGATDWPGWNWVSAAGAVALMLVAQRRIVAERASEPVPASGEGLAWISAVFAATVLYAAGERTLGLVGLTWLSVGGLIGFAVVAQRRALGAALGAGTMVAAAVMLRVVTALDWPTPEREWHALGAAWVLGVTAAVLPAVMCRLVDWISAANAKAWRALQLVAGALFVLGVSMHRPVVWDSWTSVVWAVTGVCFFVAGLYLRTRSHRIGGLVVLALCVPRVFLVDINSTLYRIAAFVVLGLVLLWVGFSYQRFKHLVNDDADDATGTRDSDEDGAKPN
ncbi:DUF2339 domain-containing protein [Congregicoccus parvus]|uniref:DUF2339 domain-containing protein n=1 Tax=Congregicoccus parvus TaxID=3081749 RepID=UPI003FA5A163